MIDYMTEVSYGKMTLEVYPFTYSSSGSKGFTVSGSESSYGSGGEAGVINGKLFRDAVAAVNTSGSTISNTIYDALLVVHAGIGQESYNVDSYIWSLFVGWTTSDGPSAGGFYEGETVPGKENEDLSPFGVLCHEFGHQLGLVDLYNTDTGKSTVGSWDLMDYGAWVNKGANPPHYSSWSKALINWITPTVQSSSTTLALNAYNSLSGNCFKIPILGSSSEYFLFEYREQAGFDSNLPGQGVLVWHIDDSKGSLLNNNVNNGTTHRVYLEERDNDNNAGTSHGEAADPFNAAGNLFTSPQSDSYTNGPSKITLSDFSGVGTAGMTAKLFAIPASANIAFNKMFNYPNPVKNAASSTLRAVFSRNVSSATLRIYSVSGELILEKPILQNDTLSIANNEWIYEYNWDLKNANGNPVSSGIYLYVISAQIISQTQTKTGKLAIIR